MKKKKKHHLKHKMRRNAGPTTSSPSPRPRTSRFPKRAPAPPWKTIAAAVAGGAGSAAIGGLIVNQKILSPEAVGVGLMLGGGAAAYFADGSARVVGTSVAAAGAGQFALATMAKQAMKTQQQQQVVQTAAAPQAPALLPPAPPAVAPPRRSSSNGGVVADLFRDAVTDLDMIDDEWRYGMRDNASPYESNEPIVIDLDQAA